MVLSKLTKSRSRVRCGTLNSLAEQLGTMQELRSEGAAQFIEHIGEFPLKVFGKDRMRNRPTNNCELFRPWALWLRSVEFAPKFLEGTSNVISAVLGVLPVRCKPAERRPIFFARVLVPDLS